MTITTTTKDVILARLEVASSSIALHALEGNNNKELWLAQIALTAAIAFLQLSMEDGQRTELTEIYETSRDDSLDTLTHYARQLGL